MPRVKVDYIVSVSSEDPENQANNLLAAEVNKKKWLCAKGEQSCSVVLQLTRAVMICAIHIGAHHAAFVEVLVGTSEKANEDYEVLVPRCVFCSPSEARKDEPVQRVRSFGASQLAEARRRRWDRVRVLCSQPYNKHSQCGLSFVHIFEPEDSTDPQMASKPAAPAATGLGNKDRPLPLGSCSSDEEEFRPGELFAKYRQIAKESDGNGHTSNTDAQIRQATSQALKNISDADTKLKKTPIAKRKRDSCDPGESQARDRSRDSLMYTADEDQPHGKIDRVVTKHKEERKKTEESQRIKNTNVKNDKVETNNNIQKNKESLSRNKDKASKKIDRPSSSGQSPRHADAEGESRRRRSDDDGAKGNVDPSIALRGVVFALSGFVQPERGRLREAALAMGARYRPDWAPDCTHLVCAFPNTPKLRQVVVSAPHAHVVNAAWLRGSAEAGRRLHERRYRVGPSAPAPAPTPTPTPTPTASQSDDQEGDTDEEIEKVVRQQKKKRRSDEPPSASAAASPPNADATDEEATEPEDDASSGDGRASPLPAFLDGRTVVVSEDVERVGLEPRLLRRYARAYGALVLPEGSDADIQLGTASDQTRPDWLWKCHEKNKLLPTNTSP